MNVLLFGASGMARQGVLRECLLDTEVQLVQTVGRTATGVRNPKLAFVGRWLFPCGFGLFERIRDGTLWNGKHSLGCVTKTLKASGPSTISG